MLGVGINLWGNTKDPYGLSLDLQFATDKTFSKPSSLAASETAITSRKGPSATFLRLSGATEVGPDGLIEYAPENLILQSENFANTSWLKTNVSVSAPRVVAPNGELTADTVSITTIGGNNLRNASVITVTPLTTYTFSFWVKRGTATDLRYSAYDNTGGVNIINPTSYYAQTSASVWTRVSITLTTPAGCTVLTIYPLRDGNSTGTVFLWGAQLERSSTARAYIPTTTAAVYAPRFDHDPITPFACRGLLIEEQRTNQCYNSNLLTSASWNSTNASIATSDTAPDGSAAFEITETEVTGYHSILNSGGATITPSTSITSGVTYTLSVFAKKSTSSVDWIQLTGTSYNFGTAQYANFNLATGAIGNYAGVTSGTIPKMEQFPNGWYRCSMTLTAISTALGNAIPVHFTNNTNITIRATSYNYLGSTANKVKVAMAQFEAGSFATSYIPTTTGIVIRSADFCSITGSAFSGMWQSATEATILLEANASIMEATTNGNRAIAMLSNGAAYSNQIGFLKESGTDFIKGRTPAGNLIQVQNSLGKFKGAIAIASSAAGCFNGAAPSTNSDAIGTVDRLTFADQTLVSGGHPSVWVSIFQIYRKRLPDARLQSLTAP